MQNIQFKRSANRYNTIFVIVSILTTIIYSNTPVFGDELNIQGVVYRQFYPSDFSRCFRFYAIVVEDSNNEEVGSGQLDGLGNFDVENVNIQGDFIVRAIRTSQEAGEFIIWPLEHPKKTKSPYNDFKFKKIADVIDIEKKNALSKIRDGQFTQSKKIMANIRELFDSLKEDPIYNDKKLDQSLYKILQESSKAAKEYRQEKNRSKIEDKMLDVEREWRRKMILITGNDDYSNTSDFIITINEWAEYSRQVYSKERSWPSRSIKSINQDNPSFFYKGSYLNLMDEDIQLIQEQIDREPIKKYIKDLIRNSNITSLDPGSKYGIEQFDQLISQNSSEVDINAFVNLLNGLNQLNARKSSSSQ